ncbi:MAG: tetratricopeptide repeat protein [Acidobacteriota bacterium]
MTRVKHFGSLLVLANLIVSTLSAGAQGEDLRNPAFMAEAREGFEQIYNLDYQDAFRTFSGLKSRNPRHPAPPLYLASVVWLEELFDRNELDLDNFIAPAYFTKPSTRKMAARDRKAFFDYLALCEALCNDLLKKDPKNADARYFLGSMYGIMGAFAITIDRSYSDAFSKGKKAYKYHSQLIQERPDFYDAYMSVGLYEYVVDNLPWYIKWIAVIVGYRGSQERGFEYLTRAAEKGLYAADDARVLQMVLFVREKRFADALANVSRLRARYPKNFILHLNQAQILEKMDKKDEAAAAYREVLHLAEIKRANYQRIPLSTFRVTAARKLLRLGDLASALTQFQRALEDPATPPKDKGTAHLGAGQALDRLGRRDEAVRQYRAVLKLPNLDESHSRAREFLSHPYQGAE